MQTLNRLSENVVGVCGNENQRGLMTDLSWMQDWKNFVRDEKSEPECYHK